MKYRVNNFYPPKEVFSSCWGFDADIDVDSALKLRDFKLEPPAVERFQEMGRDITAQFKLNNFGKIKNPYRFSNDSLMLHGVVVPGNACDLSLDESGISDFGDEYPSFREFVLDTRKRGDTREHFVHYMPHNVDMQQQAYALLSLWLHWANTAAALIS